MKAQLAAVLRNESGNFLIQAMAGSIVSLLSIGAVAGGITGITQFQVKQQLRAEVTSQAALTDSAFRGDVLWAASVKPVDDHRVEFTVLGKAGSCDVSAWSIEPAGDGTQVRVTTVTYPGIESKNGTASCTGEASEPSSTVLIGDAAAESSFTYANAAGRALRFPEGHTAVLADGEKPESVAESAWKSPAPGAVALNTAVKATSKMKTPLRIAQTADNLVVPAAAADAPEHFVPEGDLR